MGSMVDVHSHAIPQGLLARFGSVEPQDPSAYRVRIWDMEVGPVPRGLFDPESRVSDMDRADVDIQVLSPMVSPGRLEGSMVRLINDSMAEMARGHRDRLVPLAVLPVHDVQAALSELERANSELEMGGVIMWSDMGGLAPGDPGLTPIYERLEDLGLPTFVHPVLPSDPRMGRHYMSVIVGAVNEDFLAISSVILSGLLDEIPRLKLIFPHGGGAAPFQLGRIRRAISARAECRLRRDPIEYMRSMYFDTAVYDPIPIRMLVDLVGAERVMFGSDYPADIMDWEGALERLRSSLAAAEFASIAHDNAIELFS